MFISHTSHVILFHFHCIFPSSIRCDFRFKIRLQNSKLRIYLIKREVLPFVFTQRLSFIPKLEKVISFTCYIFINKPAAKFSSKY